MNIRKYCQLIATTDFVAYHCYPEAKVGYNYLRTLHRHKFYVTYSIRYIVASMYDETTKRVNLYSLNRRYEFIEMQDTLKKFIAENYENKVLDDMSCERIAEGILEGMWKMDMPSYKCRVMEDNENGCELEWYDEDEMYGQKN